MGMRHTFNCPNCKYTCEVSGRIDNGMRSRTNTFVCTDCKIIQDISINKEDANDKTINELCCKKCKGKNLVLWGENLSLFERICPKCETKMKVRPMTSMWD